MSIYNVNDIVYDKDDEAIGFVREVKRKGRYKAYVVEWYCCHLCRKTLETKDSLSEPCYIHYSMK